MISLVCHTKYGAGQDGGTTPAGFDTTGSNFLIAEIHGQFDRGTNEPTLSDSFGNTWNSLTLAGLNGTLSRLLYSVNPTVGVNHTFTFGCTVPGSGSFPGFEVAGFSGVDTVSPFDLEGADPGNSAVSSSVTPGQAGSLVVTGFNNFTTNVTGVSSPFAPIELNDLAGGVNYAGALGYVVQTTVVAAQATWSPDGGRNTVNIAVFKPAASSLIIPVPAGTLTIASFAPSIGSSMVIAVPKGSLSLSSFAPSIGDVLTIPVPAGSLRLTSYAPSIQGNLPPPPPPPPPFCEPAPTPGYTPNLGATQEPTELTGT